MDRSKFADAVAEYVVAVMSCDGALNDWLTHMPPAVRPAMEALGNVLDAIWTLAGFAC